MKKLLILLLLISAVLSLSSCVAPDESLNTPQEKLTLVINDGYSRGNASLGIIDADMLTTLTGDKYELKYYLRDETVIKMLAGDDDIDIYIVSGDELRSIIDAGLYLPIESDIISDFNSGCFDYLCKFCSDLQGNIVAMPVGSIHSGIACPAEAVDELSVKASDIEYYDGFMDFMASYSGQRKSYCWTTSLYNLWQYQYEKYYCDFANGVFDYDTEMFRELYSLLGGWVRNAQEPGTIKCFTHGLYMPKDSSQILFNVTSLSGLRDDFGNSVFDTWRAYPIPKLSEQVEGTFANANFAFINPNSKNKERAQKALEAIAENYFDVLGYYGTYSIIRKDKSEYPSVYHTDSPLFDDYYNISANGFIAEYSLLSNREDIDMYQNGEITLEEGIAMYSREINMWLNE